MLQENLNKDTVITCGLAFYAKNGTIIPVTANTERFLNPDGTISHFKTFLLNDYDEVIQKMKTKEKLEKFASIAREKDRFIRIMFHEIKTPLHVLASTTLTLKHAQPLEMKHAIDAVQLQVCVCVCMCMCMMCVLYDHFLCKL